MVQEALKLPYMKPLKDFTQNNDIQFLFTDIDDTLTDDGRVGAESYAALWALKGKGVKVVPITGRPAGWCEMIARTWPVDAIVGENGAFYFRYHEKTMKRHLGTDENERIKNQEKLKIIEKEILSQIPGTALASDQFCRLFDLAIDFCEDVSALPKEDIHKIVSIFQKHGAQAKVSSIHVNGWFGEYNKLSMALNYLKREHNIDENEAKKISAFSGDSPNDEPMFEFFPHSFGVANIKNFTEELKSPPTYVTPSSGGQGFAELAKVLVPSPSH